MKITELVWEDGKKYSIIDTVYDFDDEEVWCVVDGELIREGGCQNIARIYALEEVLQFNFQEIVSPINWQDAVQTCLDNGTSYKSYYGKNVSYNGDCIMSRISDEVQLKPADNRNDIHTITCKWVKL